MVYSQSKDFKKSFESVDMYYCILVRFKDNIYGYSGKKLSKIRVHEPNKAAVLTQASNAVRKDMRRAWIIS